MLQSTSAKIAHTIRASKILLQTMHTDNDEQYLHTISNEQTNFSKNVWIAENAFSGTKANIVTTKDSAHVKLHFTAFLKSQNIFYLLIVTNSFT